MQQSKKMQSENEDKKDSYLVGNATAPAPLPPVVSSGPLVIRPITTYNEWVAILQEQREVEGGLVVKADELTRPEGVVVGVPRRLPDGNGGFYEPQVAIGDRVAFQQRNVVVGFTPAPDSDSPYKGKTVIIISERNIMYRLPPVPFTIVE